MTDPVIAAYGWRPRVARNPSGIAWSNVFSFMCGALILGVDLLAPAFDPDLRMASIVAGIAFISMAFLSLARNPFVLHWSLHGPSFFYWLYVCAATISMLAEDARTPQDRGPAYCALLPAHMVLFCCLLLRNPMSELGKRLLPIIDGLFWGGACVSILGMTILKPSASVGRLGGDVFLSASTLGRSSGIAIVTGGLMLLSGQRRSRLRLLIVAATSVVLLRSFSKSSILATLVALCVGILLGVRRAKLKQAGLIVAVLATVSYVGYARIVERYQEYVAVNDNLPTLSGRTVLWNYIYNDLLPGHLLMGYGFHSPSVVLDHVPGWGEVYVGTSHSAFFEALLSVGVPGTLALYAALYWSIARLLRTAFWERLGAFGGHAQWPGGHSRIVLLSLGFFIAVRSFTEGSFAQAGTTDVAILALLTVGAAPPSRQPANRGLPPCYIRTDSQRQPYADGRRNAHQFRAQCQCLSPGFAVQNTTDHV